MLLGDVMLTDGESVGGSNWWRVSMVSTGISVILR